MDYRNAKNRNGIYYYPNDNFNTIIIQLNFLANNANDKAPIYDVLCGFLIKSNQVYKTDDDINRREQELYSLNLSFRNAHRGNLKMFAICANMIAPNAIQDDYSKDAFEFIRDIIQKPDFTNQEMLDLVKRNLLSDIRLDLSDNGNYVDCMYQQMVLHDERRKYDDSTDIDYISNMVQAVTLEDLEREYNLLMSNFINGVVFGNVSKEQFDSFVDYIPLTPKPQNLNYHRNLPTAEGDIEIKKDMEQSYIYVTYDIEKLNTPQLYILRNIFNSTLGLCYQTLREKYGLVYTSYADIRYYDGKLTIYAETDYSKKAKFLKALDEIMADLNSPEKLEKLMARAKEEYFDSDYIFDENSGRLVNAINSYLLNCNDGLDRNEINDGIKKLTSEELLKKTKTLRRKNIFMARSEEDE